MIILISAANADVCISMARILKTQKNYISARLIGLTPDIPWPAQHYFNEVLTLPMASSPEYETALTKIINEVKPDIFIPFSEAELAWFVKHPEVIRRLPTKTIINPLDMLHTFLDKKKTANFLKNIGVATPATYAPDEVDSANLPVIMKPRSSAGSKNITIIRNNAQLAGFIQQYANILSDFVAQELIDVTDSEFTCALWRGDNILRYCTFRRRLQGGLTGFARVEQHDAIDQTLEKIAHSIKGDFFINVQLRMRDGIPYIFEINPRFSSTVIMRHKIGFEDFIWTLDLHLDQLNIPLWQPPLNTIIFRVSDECIINAEGEIL